MLSEGGIVQQRLSRRYTATASAAWYAREQHGPILIHCDHGANRTGLVSAIYLDAVAQTSDFTAQWQLSLWYGHFPVPGIGRYAMYSSYKRFQVMSPY
ncbi:tyrosine-protein phosphatase [Cronobacter dublinensis]